MPQPLREQAERAPTWQATLSSARLCTNNVAEQFPGVAFKPHEPELLDCCKVGGRGIDGDSREQHRRRKRLEVRCLRHDVFASEVVPAASEDLRQGLSHRVAQGS